MAESDLAGALHALRASELLVPVRSSGGQELDARNVPLDEMRHGSDQDGRFLAAYTDEQLLRQYGPPGSDVIRIQGDVLLDLAAAAGERLVIDPGAPQQRQFRPDAVARAAVGPVPSIPASTAPRVRTAPATRAMPAPPPLSAPDAVPHELAAALRAALEALPQVERAWLLRRGEGWNIGVQQRREATLSDFDAVRNRLHAVATEQLGTRRLLAVTDLGAPGVRRQYAELAEPFYERGTRRGILARLFGG